jgi:hypothetical protein
MDQCVRCKKDLGFGSCIIVEVKGERVSMAHFLCAKPAEVKALYGTVTPFEFPLEEQPEKPTRKE